MRGETQRRRRQRLKSRGLCIRCGKSAEWGRAKCSACLEELRLANALRRASIDPKQTKKRAIEYKGGECQDCGFKTTYLTAYEFHHKSPKGEDIRVSILIGKKRSWDRIQKELNKCILLCATCHRIRHEKN